MTPPTRFRFLTGDHSTESPGKSYVSAGASHKPYGMHELFPSNKPIGNLQRVGGVMTPPYNPNKFQFIGQLRKTDMHIVPFFLWILCSANPGKHVS